MGTIVHVDFSTKVQDKVINPKLLCQRRKELQAGIIAPAVEDTSYEIANEHTSQPLKSLDDIYTLSEYFIQNKKYRDNMLFIVGINFGLRVSDLLTLRFSHIIDEQFRFRTTFPILEKKTKNTRKVRKNRYITINDAVMDAVTLYLENTPGIKLSDFMFRGESNRNKKDPNKPMHRDTADDILRKASKALGLTHVATHTLRKTFGYFQMAMSNNDPRKLLLLQKIFGHSTAAQTLDYIGITPEEIQTAYLELNLGANKNKWLVDTVIAEEEAS